jgi:hypothetical protein
MALFLFPTISDVPAENFAVAITAAIGLIALSAGLGLSSVAMFLMIHCSCYSSIVRS